MKIIALDYNSGTVDVFHHIPEIIEDLEKFVYEELNYKDDSEISWMAVDGDIDVRIYGWDPVLEKDVYMYDKKL